MKRNPLFERKFERSMSLFYFFTLSFLVIDANKGLFLKSAPWESKICALNWFIFDMEALSSILKDYISLQDASRMKVCHLPIESITSSSMFKWSASWPIGKIENMQYFRVIWCNTCININKCNNFVVKFVN